MDSAAQEDGAHDPSAEFEPHRPRLFALAYRLLGEAGEAEDAVQDAYLRWSSADRDAVRSPGAWLTTAVTRLCLTRLTSARARRERYIGPWLPEPVLTTDPLLDPLDTVEQQESVSMALLVLLERLTPRERAVFVLREAFGHSHGEVADILQITESNAQQLHRRARTRLAEEGRPRFEPSSAEHRRIVERFLAAAGEGDVAGLEALLAEDVTAWADGGDGMPAARHPVHGALKVGRYLRGLVQRVPAILPELVGGGLLRTHAVEVNAAPTALVTLNEHVVGAVVLELSEERIRAVRILVNPDKLAVLNRQWARTPHDAPVWSARI